MSRNDRDGLLDQWAEQQRRLRTLEASLCVGVDLLIEATDVLVRMFLLNVPVGARL